MLRKDFFMEIAKSFNRFISIFLIVAMGVAFFSGIRAAEPDMRYTADDYYDERQLMDIRVLGTLGLTDEDVTSVKALNGVSDAQGGYSIDVLSWCEDSQKVFRVLADMGDKNRIDVTEGRMPQKAGECLIDAGTIKNHSFKIGDTITFESGDDSELSETLSTNTFEVVGIGSSPEFITFTRGSTTIGDGEIDSFAVVTEDSFSSDVYTKIDVWVDGAADEVSYTDGYKDKVSPVMDALEDTLADVRCEARYASIKDEADEKISDARKELEDAKAEADEKLADARAELESSEAELADGKKTLSDKEAELADAKNQITDSERKLADGRAEISANEATLASGWQQYNDGLASYNENAAALADGRAQIEDGRAQYEAGVAELAAQKEAVYKQLDEAQKQLDELKQALDSYDEAQAGLVQINTYIEQIDDSLAKLKDPATMEEIDAGIAQCNDGIAKLDGGIAQMDALINDCVSGIDAYNGQIAALEQQLAGYPEDSQLTDAQRDEKTQIEAARDSLVNERSGLEQQKAGLEGEKKGLVDQKASIVQQKDELEQHKAEIPGLIAELEANKAELETKKVEAEKAIAYLDSVLPENGREAYENGVNELAKNRAAAEDNFAGAEDTLSQNKKRLDDKEAELADGESELSKGKAELDASLSKLQSGQAQLDSAKRTLTDGQAQLASAKQQVADGEAQIADAREELEDGEKKLKDGWKEYEDAKAEAEEKLSDGEQELADAEAEVDDIAYPKWYVSDRSTLSGHSELGDNADRIRAIGEIFPVLFFLVAALISLTTMTRMVEEQRIQIGTLKALGYSKVSIAKKYIYYALLATIGGSIVGVLIGEKILPYIIINAYKIVYPYIPNTTIPYNMKYALMAGLAAIVCITLAAFLACYKELAATPAALMRPVPPKQGKRILLERVTPLWRRLSFTQKSTLRNLFRYKKRFLMTVFGIGGCMALMVVGFGLKDSIMDIVNLQYNKIQPYSGMVILDEDATDSDKDGLYEALDHESRIERYMTAYMLNTDVASDSKSMESYVVVPEDMNQVGNFFLFNDRVSGEVYTLSDDGVIISEKTAKMLDVGIGDTIRIKEDEFHSEDVRIDKICENYVSHYIYMTPALYERVFGKAPEYNSVLISIENDSKTVQTEIGESLLRENAVLSVSYMDNIKSTLNDMLGSLDIIIVVLIISAGMLAFIVLYNLNNININERRRELASIKVLGFYDMEVAAYVYRENVYLTLIGAVFGIVLGKILHQFVIVTVEIDSCMFGRVINAPSYIYSMLLTIAFAIFVNFAMFYKLRKIDMVESLKSVE